MPAPSPSTNPSRSLSKGRLARSGSSFRSERACRLPNPLRLILKTLMSIPPVMTTSTRPARIRSTALAMAVAPDAHEVETVYVGPSIP